MKTTILSSVITLLITQAAIAAPSDLPSREEMWKMIQAQQKQIELLSNKLDSNQDNLEKTQAKVEETEEIISKNIARLETSTGNNEDDDYFDHHHAGEGWWNKTSIGGYGELHLNKGSTKDEVDSHRVVLFLGHEFTDDIRFVSEIEFEHTDEIYVEQAFLEFDLNEYNQAKVGVVLVPVGILNEVHEPTTFYGVERNVIETNIVPSTWYEGGVIFSGQLGDGFSYDVGFHSGLDSNNAAGYNIRNSREKVSNGAAESGASTARIKYSGIPGLTLAASAQYQQDISQNVDATEAEAVLLETNLQYRTGPWGLKALYAQWDIDGAGAAATGQDEQYGFYIEPSYRFPIFEESELGLFTRYNQYDLFSGNTADTEIQQVDVGVNLWPHPNVVLKADVAFIDQGKANATPDDEIISLGAGFMF